MLRPYTPCSPFLRSQHTRHRQHQRESPECDRQRRGRREAHDGTGVRRGEDRHDEHQEGRHGRETSPPYPLSAMRRGGARRANPVALSVALPQIARSMRPPLRLTVLGTTCLLLIPALTGGAMLVCQEPSAYVPLDDWTMPYVEHLIATGAIPAPPPLTRPLRRSDVLRALAAADTGHLRPPPAAPLRRPRPALAAAP